MHVDTPDGPKEYLFADDWSEKLFYLWGGGMLEEPLEALFDFEELENDEVLLTALGSQKKGPEEPPEESVKADYASLDGDREPEAAPDIELRLEPLGVDRKTAKQQRETGSRVVAARFKLAVKEYERDIRKILGDPKASSLDQEFLKALCHVAIQNFSTKLSITSEQAVRLLLEDGMASVGVDMLTQRLSPEIVRAFYYDSPVWEAYARMTQDLVRATNDVIMNKMINVSGLDKYGKPHGLDKAEMTRELVQVVGIGERRARLIARTESRVIQNKGKEIGFKIRDPAGEWRYKWGGPYDPEELGGRLRPACREVIDNMPEGGYTLEELKLALHEAVRKYTPELTPRDFSGGPNCRHFPQKIVTRFTPPQPEQEEEEL